MRIGSSPWINANFTTLESVVTLNTTPTQLAPPNGGRVALIFAPVTGGPSGAIGTNPQITAQGGFNLGNTQTFPLFFDIKTAPGLVSLAWYGISTAATKMLVWEILERPIDE